MADTTSIANIVSSLSSSSGTTSTSSTIQIFLWMASNTTDPSETIETDNSTNIKTLKEALEDLSISCDEYCREFESYAEDNCKDAVFVKDKMHDALKKVFNDDIQ